jgi:hypothetical protein
MSTHAVVDTSISSPPPDFNVTLPDAYSPGWLLDQDSGERDPEMHQAEKGNEWYFW